MDDITDIVEIQKKFFNTNATKDIKLRKEKLRTLYEVIKDNTKEIEEALYKDLGKAEFEAYETEIGITLSEIRFVLKHLSSWAKVRKVKSPILHFPSKSYIYYEPYGTVLIMSPWNYPFQLCMVPLIGAIASGNTVILKPSKYSMNTSLLIEKLISQVFHKQYVAVIQGGREENTKLLKQKFDYIFFTGSPRVGKVVMEEASHNLTPVTLELGGKSPCIVDETSDIDLSAKRIAWGKYVNCGQTCIAPDYILVQEDVKEELVEKLKFYIEKFYTSNPLGNKEYPKIISKKHFDRLNNLLTNEMILYGGCIDENKNKIEPTLIDERDINTCWNSPVMQEEIFGPLFPIVTYKDIDELISILKTKDKPLALYLFTNSKSCEKRMVNELSFGGGTINDTLIHITNENMCFGGVGNSGMGQYHGYKSFETFSHIKAIMKKSNLIDINLRYPPFKKNAKMLKRLMK